MVCARVRLDSTKRLVDRGDLGVRGRSKIVGCGDARGGAPIVWRYRRAKNRASHRLIIIHLYSSPITLGDCSRYPNKRATSAAGATYRWTSGWRRTRYRGTCCPYGDTVIAVSTFHGNVSLYQSTL